MKGLSVDMPSFVHTKVDPEQLRTTANNIDGCIQSLQTAFRAVDNALSSDLLPTWEGPASDQFFAQYSSDISSFTKQVADLNAINDQLKRAAGLFDNADVRAQAEVARLQI